MENNHNTPKITPKTLAFKQFTAEIWPRLFPSSFIIFPLSSSTSLSKSINQENKNKKNNYLPASLNGTTVSVISGILKT